MKSEKIDEVSGESLNKDGKNKTELKAGFDKAVGSVQESFKEIKNDKKMLAAAGLGAGAVLAVLLVIALVTFGVKHLSPSYSVVNRYLKGCQKMDVDSQIKLYHEDMIDAFEEEEDADFEDLIEEFFEEWEDEELEILDYKIIGSTKLTEDDLEWYAENFEEDYDIDEDSIESVIQYHVLVHGSEDGDETKGFVNFPVVKIDGKWYMAEIDY